MSSSSMPWVKVYTEFIDDPKIGRLSDSAKLRFIQLVLMAGECDKEGYLANGHEPLKIEDVAWRLRVDVKQLQDDVNALITSGLVRDDDGVWLITNFAKRQGRSQDEKRAQWRDSKRRHKDSTNVPTQPSDIPTGIQQEQASTPNGFQPPEERRGEKRREEEEKTADAGASAAPSADPLPSAPPTEPEPHKGKTRPRDLLFDAIAEVTASNVQLLGGRIAKCAKELHKINATPEQVQQVAGWYAANDWRGRKGEKLTFATLVEVWELGLANKPAAEWQSRAAQPPAEQVIPKPAQRPIKSFEHLPDGTVRPIYGETHDKTTR